MSTALAISVLWSLLGLCASSLIDAEAAFPLPRPVRVRDVVATGLMVVFLLSSLMLAVAVIAS